MPEDNPFVGTADARPELYSIGHRNPQGMAREAATGRIYAIEHGPKGGDELNLIEPGGELRLARDHLRQELYGLQDRRRHPQGRDGPAGALLGAVHLAVGADDLRR